MVWLALREGRKWGGAYGETFGGGSRSAPSAPCSAAAGINVGYHLALDMPAGGRHQTCVVADASLIMFRGGGRNSTYIAKQSMEYLHEKCDEAIAKCHGGKE